MQKIKIQLSRNSVCAGDDIFAHDKIIETHGFITPVTLIKNIYPSYLPLVNGIGHKWEVFLNDILIGIVKGNHDVVSKIPEVAYNENNNKMFFKYHSANY